MQACFKEACRGTGDDIWAVCDRKFTKQVSSETKHLKVGFYREYLWALWRESCRVYTEKRQEERVVHLLLDV